MNVVDSKSSEKLFVEEVCGESVEMEGCLL